MKEDKKKIKLTKADFAENFLYLNGKKFSLSDYPHMRDIYNSTAREVVLMFSRQTAKSTTLANLMLINAATMPYFKIMYISPTVKQTKLFSQERVAPIIDSSPLIRNYYINSSMIQNVFNKTLLNGSVMHILYALLNADKLRGFSIDQCIFDETQSLKEDVIPIIKESMSRSLYKYCWYTGTPLRSKGTLANLWHRSTMNEYTIKCPHCNNWNIMAEENIGANGVICSKCFKPMNIHECRAEWVSTFSLTQKPDLEGYRICLLHFDGAPWVNWKQDVILKQQLLSKAVFFNEVLALEHDSGATPITVMELQALCDPELYLKTEPDNKFLYNTSIMGVDYGPINSENSYTVITIVQRQNDKYIVPYMKKFIGKEADFSYIHKEIPRLMEQWNCKFLAADYGMGEASNSEIRAKIGSERVIAFQYMREQKESIKWNSKMPAYTLSKVHILNNIFNAFKHGKYIFPKWEYSKDFLNDILNEQIEYDELSNKTRYTNNGPDDFLHSLVYATLAMEMLNGESILI